LFHFWKFPHVITNILFLLILNLDTSEVESFFFFNVYILTTFISHLFVACPYNLVSFLLANSILSYWLTSILY
jgi:hypothetical protein